MSLTCDFLSPIRKCAIEVTWSNSQGIYETSIVISSNFEMITMSSHCKSSFTIIHCRAIIPYLQMLSANSNPEHLFLFLYFLYILYIYLFFCVGTIWNAWFEMIDSCRATEGCAHWASPIAATATTKILSTGRCRGYCDPTDLSAGTTLLTTWDKNYPWKPEPGKYPMDPKMARNFKRHSATAQTRRRREQRFPLAFFFPKGSGSARPTVSAL